MGIVFVKIDIMRNFIAIFSIVLCFTLNAQNGDQVITEDGKTYCVHKIQKGETLYALSKKYAVKVNDIEQSNDTLSNNLSLGQKIKIPCEEAEANILQNADLVTTSTIDEFKGNYIFHTIIAGETIYSITKKFKISKEQLYKDNEEVKRIGLKIDEVIKILQVEDTDEDHIVIERHFLNVLGDGTLNSFAIDSNILKDTNFFQLAIMLPFQYERNVEFMKEFKEDQKPKLYRETKTFIELYQGIKMAVDSIVKLGLNIQLFVYDTNADTNEIKKIIQKPESKYFDLVIGPGYTSTFVFASKYFKKLGIPMISPLSENKKVIENNPFAIKIVPSYDNHLEAITSYVNENYLNENIIIAIEDENDRNNALKIQRDILAEALMNDSSINLKTSIVQGDIGVTNKLVTDKKNIVILANNKESFTSKLAVKLVRNSTANDIYLFGNEAIKEYRNIEVAYWDSLNVHITGSQNIKYGYPLADEFIGSYFQQFYNEPSRFAFSGYDFTFMFLKQVLETKKYTNSSIVGNYFVGGYRDYQFKYNGPQNGISNKAVNIYRFQDFKFRKVND